ncbi:MAG: hypothetical protein IAE79_05800 [Anaerolinea sp.]|nr:hypothetical protein [Anaerolinea sp.]
MIGAVWSVTWANPHTSPPEGKPRILAERFYPIGHPNLRACPQELEVMRSPGSGYVVVWAPISAPPKKLPQDKLAIVRHKRLRRRMEKKYPLVAEWMIEQEIRKKPTFYAGITDEKIENARDMGEALIRQRIARLIDEYEKREVRCDS